MEEEPVTTMRLQILPRFLIVAALALMATTSWAGNIVVPPGAGSCAYAVSAVNTGSAPSCVAAPTPAPTATPQPSPTEQPSPTLGATATPQPSPTSVPTATPQPTATAAPTATVQPSPTAVSTPTPITLPLSIANGGWGADFTTTFIPPQTKTLTNNTNTGFLRASLGTTSSMGYWIHFCAEVTDGTNMATRCGGQPYTCIRVAAGTVTSNGGSVGTQNTATVSSGCAITVTFANVNNATTCDLAVNINGTTCTPTLVRLNYWVFGSGVGGQTLTPL